MKRLRREVVLRDPLLLDRSPNDIDIDTEFDVEDKTDMALPSNIFSLVGTVLVVAAVLVEAKSDVGFSFSFSPIDDLSSEEPL